MYAKEERMETMSHSFFFLPFHSFLKNGSVTKTAIGHVGIPLPGVWEMLLGAGKKENT